MTASTRQAAEILRSLNEDGERQFAAGNLDAAQQLFERALDINHRDATTLNNLAVCHWGRGEVVQALRCVASGLEIAPDNVELAINGGSILESCGCAELARCLYRSFLEQSPDATQVRARLDPTAQSGGEQETTASIASDTQSLNQRGEDLFRQGDLAAAEEAFRHCIEIDAKHVDALNNLGVLLWQQGDTAQALQVLARGLALEPNNPTLVANSGQVLASGGRTGEAKSLYESYLRQFPGDQTIAAQLQNLDDAAVTRPAGGLQPGSSMPPASGFAEKAQAISTAELVHQGESLHESGDAEGAARVFEQALRLDPKDIEALNNLGTISWNAGDVGPALAYFRQALEINADHRPSLINCAVVLEALGYEEDARRVRQRVGG